MALAGKANFKKRTKKVGTRTYADRSFNRNALVELNMSDLYDRFMSYKRTEGLSRITLRDYDVHYGYFIDFLEEKEGVRDLLHSELRLEVFTDYIAYMIDKELMSNTINVRIRTIRAFLRWCYEEEYIDRPIHQKFKPVKAPQNEIEAFTPAEIRDLLATMDTKTYVGFRDYVMVMVLLDTMVRASELLTLKRSDVNLKTGEIHLEADNTKTKKFRILPISNKTNRLLTEYFAETEEFREDVLFLTYDGRPVNDSTFRKRLIEYGEMANLRHKRVSPHTMRHTGALLYILNGGDPFSLQKILGHTDLSMVRRYVNMVDGNVKSQHEHFSPLKSVFNK